MPGELALIADLSLKLLFAGGGIVLFIKLGRLIQTMQQQSADISELKTETKKIGEVLTVIAVQKQEIEHIKKQIDELRHGESFVFPLSRSLGGDR